MNAPRGSNPPQSSPWRPEVVVCDDPIERAGQRLATALLAILAESDRVRLAIPGGSALRSALVAKRRLGPEWARVKLTWTDERCVPVSDDASNRGEAMRLGLLPEDRPGLAPPGAALPLFLDDETAAQAVARARRRFEVEFANGLDINLLGMGSDGHIASLFPGQRPTSPSADEDFVFHVCASPKPPADRITLSRAALATAKQSFLVATGEEKRQALEALADGDPKLPATGLANLVVMTNLKELRVDSRM